MKNFAAEGTENKSIFTFKWSDTGGDTLNAQKCKVFLTDGSQIHAQIKTVLDISIWNHVVCTFDGQELRAYLNGNLEANVRTSGFVYNGESGLSI
jgi:hypothetical protein